jgi:hypothetical protein
VTPTKSKFGAQKQLYSTARLRAWAGVITACECMLEKGSRP